MTSIQLLRIIPVFKLLFLYSSLYILHICGADIHIIIRSATPHERRASGSGFSFRLDERAEKRREVVNGHYFSFNLLTFS